MLLVCATLFDGPATRTPVGARDIDGLMLPVGNALDAQGAGDKVPSVGGESVSVGPVDAAGGAAEPHPQSPTSATTNGQYAMLMPPESPASSKSPQDIGRDAQPTSATLRTALFSFISGLVTRRPAPQISHTGTGRAVGTADGTDDSVGRPVTVGRAVTDGVKDGAIASSALVGSRDSAGDGSLESNVTVSTTAHAHMTPMRFGSSAQTLGGIFSHRPSRFSSLHINSSRFGKKLPLASLLSIVNPSPHTMQTGKSPCSVGGSDGAAGVATYQQGDHPSWIEVAATIREVHRLE